MREIIDEVYIMINGETDTEWITQYASLKFPEKSGYSARPKLFNDNEREMFYVGAVHYMFVFHEDGRGLGTMISLLNNRFNQKDNRAVNKEIAGLREHVLTSKSLFKNDFSGENSESPRSNETAG